MPYRLKKSRWCACCKKSISLRDAVHWIRNPASSTSQLMCAFATRKKNSWHLKNRDKCKLYRATMPQRFKAGIGAALRRNLSWDLTLEQFVQVASKPCHYCGLLVGRFFSGSGLDRKENLLPYNLSNVVSCCSACNLIKGDSLTEQEMLSVALCLKELRGQTTQSWFDLPNT